MLRPVLALLVGSILLLGCTSPDKKKKAKVEDEPGVEYVYYTPTGSHIPIRVRKDQLKPSDSDGDKIRDTFADL